MAIRIHRVRQFISIFFERGNDFISDQSGYPVDEKTLDYVEGMLLKTRKLLQNQAELDAIVEDLNAQYEEQEARDNARNSEINKQKNAKKLSHVYLMHDRNSGLYKIGKAENPIARHKQIRTSNPHVTLLCAFKAEPIEEVNMHVLFSDRCILGEWFRLSPEDLKEFHRYFTALGSDCILYSSNN